MGHTNDVASTEPAIQTTSRASSSTGKRKSIKSQAEVWNHFTKFVNEQGEHKARCNYCDKEFCADPKLNGTTSLNFHKKVCQKISNLTDLSQAELVFSSGDGSLGNWKFDQESIRKGLVEMILDELPFKFVEGKRFKRFMSLSCPRYHIPS